MADVEIVKIDPDDKRITYLMTLSAGEAACIEAALASAGRLSTDEDYKDRALEVLLSLEMAWVVIGVIPYNND